MAGNSASWSRDASSLVGRWGWVLGGSAGRMASCFRCIFPVFFSEDIHPGKLSCPLKRDYFNRKYIFQPSIFRWHVRFRECIFLFSSSIPGEMISIWRAYSFEGGWNHQLLVVLCYFFGGGEDMGSLFWSTKIKVLGFISVGRITLNDQNHVSHQNGKRKTIDSKVPW